MLLRQTARLRVFAVKASHSLHKSPALLFLRQPTTLLPRACGRRAAAATAGAAAPAHEPLQHVRPPPGAARLLRLRHLLLLLGRQAPAPQRGEHEAAQQHLQAVMTAAAHARCFLQLRGSHGAHSAQCSPATQRRNAAASSAVSFGF